jgi:hypothetical protein
MKCPRCGYDPSRDPDWRSWERRDYRAYGLAETLPAGSEYERRKPERSASLESDALVPVVQSLVSALVASISAGVASALTGIWQPFPAAGVCGVGALALSWLVLLREHRGLLWDVERVISGNFGTESPTGTPQDVLRVEITEHKGHNQHISYLELPGTPQQLMTLANGLLGGKGTSESDWTGSGKPFSRSEFREIRTALIDRGLATWANPDHHAQGWELTAAGRAVMRRIADHPTLSDRRPQTDQT